MRRGPARTHADAVNETRGEQRKLVCKRRCQRRDTALALKTCGGRCSRPRCRGLVYTKIQKNQNILSLSFIIRAKGGCGANAGGHEAFPTHATRAPTWPWSIGPFTAASSSRALINIPLLPLLGGREATGELRCPPDFARVRPLYATPSVLRGCHLPQ